jgi:hypothetical protein
MENYVARIRNRGELLQPTNIVRLTIQYNDNYGHPVNADSFPQVSIIAPSGLVEMAPTSVGVQQIGVGNYLFEYTIDYAPGYGVYEDVWKATINGFLIEQTFSFVVSQGDLPALNTDGQKHIGDVVGLDYSQCAIQNLNKLMRTLKARLNSSGKAKSTDGYGNVIYVDCDIYSVDMLATFIADSITMFNEIPYFTFFSMEDTEIIDQFHNIFVEGATLTALASQALIEKGREFQITDNGVNFNPPTIAELLQTQYSTMLSNYWEKIKYIKNSLRPRPLGLGTLRPLASNPQFMRLRHLRERQLF